MLLSCCINTSKRGSMHGIHYTTLSQCNARMTNIFLFDMHLTRVWFIGKENKFLIVNWKRFLFIWCKCSYLCIIIILQISGLQKIYKKKKTKLELVFTALIQLTLTHILYIWPYFNLELVWIFHIGLCTYTYVPTAICTKVLFEFNQL